MLADLQKQKNKLDGMRVEQRALLTVIQGLKATIADMSKEHKSILMKAMDSHMKKNRHSAIQIERIR